jgi:DNA repair protein RadC
VFDDLLQSAAEQASPTKSAPSYKDHRKRLRARAGSAGLETLPDYEALELFLFRSIPRKEVKPLAKALIARFGSLSGVLGASSEDICAVKAVNASGETIGAGPETALDLRLMHDLACRVAREPLKKRTVITSWSQLLAYARLSLAHAAREEFRVLFLDKKNQLILDERMNRGTVDHAPVYPREVVRRALELNASALILVHNHPSGDPTPSAADVEMTRQIVEAAKALGLSVHDHIVVGRDGTASLKALGLM